MFKSMTTGTITFEEAIQATAAQRAPWSVVPADHKWFTRLVVAAAIVEAGESLGLRYPQINATKMKELVTACEALAREPWRSFHRRVASS